MIKTKNGKPFYTGDDKVKKLAELASQANESHAQVGTTFRDMLGHAKTAGEALNEAKRILGHRRKWSRWRAANFTGSIRNARVYAQVARHWNHPDIKRARAAGLEPTSIQGFLNLLQGKPVEHKRTTVEISQRDLFRLELRAQIDAHLRDTELPQLKAWQEGFNSDTWALLADCLSDPKFWQQVHASYENVRTEELGYRNVNHARASRELLAEATNRIYGALNPGRNP